MGVGRSQISVESGQSRYHQQQAYGRQFIGGAPTVQLQMVYPEEFGRKIAVHPSVYYHPDIHICQTKELKAKIGLAINDNRYFYIGYTNRPETTYVRNSLPKSEEWKDKFKTWETYWAIITGTGVTEKGLIEEYGNHHLCTNRQGGRKDTTGFIYILNGKVAN